MREGGSEEPPLCLPGRDSPRYARPIPASPARTHRAQPSIASPRHACLARPNTTSPRHALPALPCPTVPVLTRTHTAMTAITRRTAPRLAIPCLSMSCHVCRATTDLARALRNGPCHACQSAPVPSCPRLTTPRLLHQQRTPFQAPPQISPERLLNRLRISPPIHTGEAMYEERQPLAGNARPYAPDCPDRSGNTLRHCADRSRAI